MRLHCVAPLLALLALGACSNARRVEQPLDEVHARLVSMPADANAIALATTFPGIAYYLEPDGGRLVWHFTHNGKDYGRFIATLKEDGPATSVSTSFESADDAPLAGKLGFLRKIARIAAEASVDAALAQRPVDRAAVQQLITQQVTRDPMAAHAASIEIVSAEMDRFVEESRQEDNEPAYPKPGVYPRRGGQGGPAADRDRKGSETWRN